MLNTAHCTERVIIDQSHQGLSLSSAPCSGRASQTKRALSFSARALYQRLLQFQLEHVYWELVSKTNTVEVSKWLVIVIQFW